MISATMAGLCLAGLSSCSVTIGEAREAADRSERLADSGNYEKARRLARETRSKAEPESRAHALLGYTEAWIHYRESETASDESTRLECLSRFVDALKQVLDVHPSYVDAIDGLAEGMLELAQRKQTRLDDDLRYLQRHLETGKLEREAAAAVSLALGDLSDAAEMTQSALRHYQEAADLGRAEGYTRMVALSGLPLSALQGLCGSLASKGQYEAARVGYERLLESASTRDAALPMWLIVTALQRTLDVKLLESLPSAGRESAGLQAIEQAIDFVESSSLRVGDAGFRDKASALLDQIGFETLSSRWKRAVVWALRAMAHSWTSPRSRIPQAAAMLEIALLAAERSEIRNAVFDEPTNLHLDTAIELAVFYYSSPLPESAGRLRYLADGPLRTSYVSRLELPMKEAFNYYSKWGRILFDKVQSKVLQDELDRDTAVWLLERAVRLAKELREPAPELSRAYARALVATGRELQAFRVYEDAFRFYSEYHSREEAVKIGEEYLRFSKNVYQEVDLLRERAESILFAHGAYAGVGIGGTDGGNDSRDLENAVNANLGGRNARVTLDDTDTGYKAFLGFRRRGEHELSSIGLELGYTSLGKTRTSVQNLGGPDPTLARDVLDLQPLSGRGPFLSVVVYPFEVGRFQTFVRSGVWWWQSQTDVNVDGIDVQQSRNDIDPFVGGGVGYRLPGTRVGLRVEYEGYVLRDDTFQMLSVSLVFHF